MSGHGQRLGQLLYRAVICAVISLGNLPVGEAYANEDSEVAMTNFDASIFKMNADELQKVPVIESMEDPRCPSAHQIFDQDTDKLRARVGTVAFLRIATRLLICIDGGPSGDVMRTLGKIFDENPEPALREFEKFLTVDRALAILRQFPELGVENEQVRLRLRRSRIAKLNGIAKGKELKLATYARRLLAGLPQDSEL
ncbi:MAG TPA: hypothetical protein PLZ57_00640 [Pseudobdellovibrionaceae bacterium]|nr:hypothetical protein [Pseudobdellovibrionaceae bacterium]